MLSHKIRLRSLYCHTITPKSPILTVRFPILGGWDVSYVARLGLKGCNILKGSRNHSDA